MSCLLIFVLSRFGATFYSTSVPRYLLPLYTATPLVLDCLIPRRPSRPAIRLAALALGMLVIAGLTTTRATAPRPSIAGLTFLLEQRHIRVSFANDYWIVYRIEFETHERVLSVGVDDSLRVGFVRIPSDLRVAAHTPANGVAWVLFVRRPAGEHNFRLLLQREHLRARRTVWADRVIYDRVSRPLRAFGLSGANGLAL